MELTKEMSWTLILTQTIQGIRSNVLFEETHSRHQPNDSRSDGFLSIIGPIITNYSIALDILNRLK